MVLTFLSQPVSTKSPTPAPQEAVGAAALMPKWFQKIDSALVKQDVNTEKKMTVKQKLASVFRSSKDRATPAESRRQQLLAAKASNTAQRQWDHIFIKDQIQSYGDNLGVDPRDTGDTRLEDPETETSESDATDAFATPNT